MLEAEVADILAISTDDERAAFERAGVTFGAGVVYLSRGLAPASVAARVALASAWFGTRALRAPSGGAVSFAPRRGVDARAYAAIGYPAVGPRAVRADVLDRVLGTARDRQVNDGPSDATIATWLGCSSRDARRILGTDTARGGTP